jgi:hypothetical protein
MVFAGLERKVQTQQTAAAGDQDATHYSIFPCM